MHWGRAVAAAGLVWLGASPAAAQVTLSGEAEIVSDYRYRGLSLSNGKPALQASAEVDSGAGFHLGGFASWVPHGGGSAAVELDASGGYRLSLAEGVTLDGAASWYHYPRAAESDYGEAIATLGLECGDTSVHGGAAWAPRQPHLIDGAGQVAGNFYGFVGGEQALAGTPVSLSVDAGYESGAFDGAVQGGKIDWRLGIAASASGFTVSAHYIGAARPQANEGEYKHERGLVFGLQRSF